MNNEAAAILRLAMDLDEASPADIGRIRFFEDSRTPPDVAGRRLGLVKIAEVYLFAVRYDRPYDDLMGTTGTRLTNRTRAVLDACDVNTASLELVRRGIETGDFGTPEFVTVE